ncbi:MAG TPA: hypothetical protein VIM59_00210 [Cellvibrio sp.]
MKIAVIAKNYSTENFFGGADQNCSPAVIEMNCTGNHRIIKWLGNDAEATGVAAQKGTISFFVVYDSNFNSFC